MIQKYMHSIWTGDEPTRLFEPLPSKIPISESSDSMKATYNNYEGKNKCSTPDVFKNNS